MIQGLEIWASGLLLLATLVTLALPLRTRRPQWIATLIAGLALVWLTLPARPTVPDGPVLLITAGATASGLDNAGLTVASARPGFVLGHDGDWPAPTERIADTGVIARRYPGLEVQVAGHGLDPWDIERLQTRITPLAVPPLPADVERVSWQRSLGVGEPLLVSGRLTASFDGIATLRLTGTGGNAEVQIDTATDPHTFDIELTPPGPGRFLFELSLAPQQGVARRIGTIDVDVQGGEPPALLWLERAPSFETRHVKEWLADRGGRLAVRSAISRERFRYEYHNLPRSNLTRLTADRLDPFDVVVTDQSSWNALTPSERRLLEGQVTAGALGILLRLDPTRSNLPFGARVRRIEGLEHLMFKPTFSDPATDPIAIPPFELEPFGDSLIHDQSGRILAQRFQSGSGAVAVTTVADSYRWALGGSQRVHHEYWTTLIEGVVPATEETRWLLRPGPVLAHEPFTVELISRVPPYPTLYEPDGSQPRLAMRQHPTQPHRFSAVIRPRMAGWHRLSIAGVEAAFHAEPATGWQGWRFSRRQRATQIAASSQDPASPHTPASAWGRLLALVTVLTALAFAWIDERRGRRAG